MTSQCRILFRELHLSRECDFVCDKMGFVIDSKVLNPDLRNNEESLCENKTLYKKFHLYCNADVIKTMLV